MDVEMNNIIDVICNKNVDDIVVVKPKINVKAKRTKKWVNNEVIEPLQNSISYDQERQKMAFELEKQKFELEKMKMQKEHDFELSKGLAKTISEPVHAKTLSNAQPTYKNPSFPKNLDDILNMDKFTFK